MYDFKNYIGEYIQCYIIHPRKKKKLPDLLIVDLDVGDSHIIHCVLILLCSLSLKDVHN